METMENSLNLRFEETPANQQQLISFLKLSFSDEEIYSIGRLLNLEKDDYVGKGMTKQQLCGSFVEMLVQRSLFDRLFILLQSPTFFRPRLYHDFRDLGIKAPIEKENLLQIAEDCFKQSENKSQYSSFAEWLEDCKNRMVLVLGKDNTEEAWLKLTTIKKLLVDLGYAAVLIKEQPDIGPLTNEEKMLAYAAISRFIVIEKSEPAGQIDEAHICAINRLTGVWLREEGKGDTWMQADYEVSYHHVKGFEYKVDNMEAVIKSGVKWAENYLVTKEQTLNNMYPFRR